MPLRRRFACCRRGRPRGVRQRERVTSAVATRVDACRLCGTPFEQVRRRGRPRELCPSCSAPVAAAKRAAEKQRAYYEANKDEIAEKQRADREANRADSKRGLKTITCTTCDERLAHRTPDGLCGFCRQGIAA